MAVGVGVAVAPDFVALPLGTLAEHEHGVVARVCLLLLHEQGDELVEIDLVFGDEAADRGDVRRVERREPGVAPEDAEDADPLVRGDGDRCWIASEARVIAVEKPMQYSVLRTLSIVFGMPMILTPSALRVAA